MNRKKKATLSIPALVGKPTTISEKFHEKTKLKQSIKDPGIENWPEEWKEIYYKGYARLPEILLPKPMLNSRISYKSVLTQRNSKRKFSPEPLTLQSISSLLYYSAGLQRMNGQATTNRFYPSAGARYPLEVYLLSLNSTLPKGLYHYYVKNNSLEKLLEIKTFEFNKYFLQDSLAKASYFILITGVFKRNTVKYGERGYRHVLQESGHLAQNFYLTAAALNLACCATAGFIDDTINNLLDIQDRTESVLYTLAIGQDFNG